MRYFLTLLACLPICASADPLVTAEAFIDAFYSWDRQTLENTLTSDTLGAEQVTYYQGWAKGGNYAIQNRRPCAWAEEEIQCPITVTDDFGKTLGYTATDTFHLTIQDSKVASVRFTADDPPIFSELQAWMMAERPEIFAGPCKDFFAGGTTPGDCARAVANAAREFMAKRGQSLDADD